MKRLILFPLILLVIGCSDADKNTITMSKSEYQQLTGDTLYPKPFELYTSGLPLYGSGIVLASDGHDYLVIHYGSNHMNIEHYIECEKCKKLKPE